MIKNLVIAATLAATVAAPVLASDFTARNRMKVKVISADEFTVFGSARLGAQSYWCAAGAYAQARLGLAGRDRLYVTQPLSKGVLPRFSANPKGVSATRTRSAVVAIGTEGSSLSVGQATSFCLDETPSSV